MSKEAKVGYKKNIGTILLLSFAGSIIYGLPYFRSYYYDTYQAMYHLTNTQMGLLGSAYGVLGVFSYIIGGVLADKIKAKKLLIFSMIATGLGGLLHLFVNNFYALVVIYGLWGVTSLLTFWPALSESRQLRRNKAVLMEPLKVGEVYSMRHILQWQQRFLEFFRERQCRLSELKELSGSIRWHR